MAVHKRIRRSRVLRVWCPECGREVDMVDPREAEAITLVTGSVLRDCARWHVAQSPDGAGLICLDSLLKSV